MRKTESPELALCSLLGHEWEVFFAEYPFYDVECTLCHFRYDYFDIGQIWKTCSQFTGHYYEDIGVDEVPAEVVATVQSIIKGSRL